MDDLLLIGDHKGLMWVVDRLGQDFQTKLTGVLKPKEVGKLEFLGRELRRSTPGGHLTMSMHPSYIDAIESLLGQHSLKTLEGIPKLAKYVVEAGKDEELESAEATLFRSALGKLAWLALSLPMGAYHISFLSTFQSMLKIFSRRIPSVCLSSAESELFGIIETTHESLSIAILIETLMTGLPDRGYLGEFVRVAGTTKVHLRTDSEAVKNISVMSGLLRKVKHLELRVMRIQELTALGRLLLEYLPGPINPSDYLTKDSDLQHLLLLLEAIGLQEDPSQQGLQLLSESLMAYLGPLSSQNKRRIERAVDRLLAWFPLQQVWDSNVLEEHVKQTDEVEDVSPTTRSRLDMPVKAVKFLDQPDIQEFQIETEEENLQAYRSIPLTWKRILKRHPELSIYQQPLVEWCRGAGPLVIEICCEEQSGIRLACNEFHLPYLGISKSIPVEHQGIQALLRAVLERPGAIYVWISSPCTAGCRYRFINNFKFGPHKWRRSYEQRKDIWRAIGRIFLGREGRKALYITQEWPLLSACLQLCGN